MSDGFCQQYAVLTSVTFTNLESPKRDLSPNPNLNASTNRCASKPASGAGNIPSSIRRMKANIIPEPGGGPTCTVYLLFNVTGKDSSIETLKTVHFFLIFDFDNII